MFEETMRHSEPEVAPSPQNIPNTTKDNRSLALSRFEAVFYWHPTHQRFIRQWLAQGYTKNKQTAIYRKWFLYSEYQDKQGNNHYVQHLFGSLDDALAYAESGASIEEIRES